MTDLGPTMSSFVCEFEGCDNGPVNGHALYRTSATGPGQTFRGRCSMHMGEAVDPITFEITEAIEHDNFALRDDDLTPMTPEQVEWVRAQRKKGTGPSHWPDINEGERGWRPPDDTGS